MSLCRQWSLPEQPPSKVALAIGVRLAELPLAPAGMLADGHAFTAGMDDGDVKIKHRYASGDEANGYKATKEEG